SQLGRRADGQRRAGAWRRLRPRLRRIIFRRLAFAVEGVEAGFGRAAGGRLAIARRLADARRPAALRWLARATRIPRYVAGLGRGSPQRPVLRRDKAALLRAEERRRQGLRVRRRGVDGDQRKGNQSKARPDRAADARASGPAASWPPWHDQ